MSEPKSHINERLHTGLAQSGHGVDERYDEILKLLESAQAGEESK